MQRFVSREIKGLKNGQSENNKSRTAGS
jgi:hypothetical protein